MWLVSAKPKLRYGEAKRMGWCPGSIIWIAEVSAVEYIPLCGMSERRMTAWAPVVALCAIVAAVLSLHRTARCAPVFRWLPAPLWCYALPMAAAWLGWLPGNAPAYRVLTSTVLPFALTLLLLGVDLRTIARAGWPALAATAIGSVSIVVGAPLVAVLFSSRLPAEAWKGVGALAATWTGGSMNLLALKTILGTPESMFTSLIVVDACVTYSWMALLVGLAPHRAPIDRWLQARPMAAPAGASDESAKPGAGGAWVAGAFLCALLITTGASWLASRLPTNAVVTSRQGWVILLATSAALASASRQGLRRCREAAERLGYPCLYVVLAAMGAQASLSALRATPVWLLIGAGTALAHGLTMIVAGRLLRLPLGVLATASQANLGGVASTPLVGAVYEQSLAAVGLLLAVGCNAVGTYLGLAAAMLSRWLTR